MADSGSAAAAADALAAVTTSAKENGLVMAFNTSGPLAASVGVMRKRAPPSSNWIVPSLPAVKSVSNAGRLPGLLVLRLLL